MMCLPGAIEITDYTPLIMVILSIEEEVEEEVEEVEEEEGMDTREADGKTIQ